MKRMRTSAGEISSNSVTLDDDRVYYSTNLACQIGLDDGIHGRFAQFTETRLRKLVANPDDYTIACKRLSLETKTLPLFQPQVVLGQTNPNLLNYQPGFEFVWTGSTNQAVDGYVTILQDAYCLYSMPYNVTPAGVTSGLTFPVGFNYCEFGLATSASFPYPAAADYGTPSSGYMDMANFQDSVNYFNAIWNTQTNYFAGNVVTVGPGTNGSINNPAAQLSSYICILSAPPGTAVTNTTYYLPIIRASFSGGPVTGIINLDNATFGTYGSGLLQGGIAFGHGQFYVYTAATSGNTQPAYWPTWGTSNALWTLCTQPPNATIPFWMFIIPGAYGDGTTLIMPNTGIFGNDLSNMSISIDLTLPISNWNKSLGVTTTSVVKTAKYLGLMPGQVCNVSGSTNSTTGGGLYTTRISPQAFTRTFELYAYRNLLWVPEDETAVVPAAPLVSQDFGALGASTYYNCYDYDWFLTNSVNPAFRRCIDDPNDSFGSSGFLTNGFGSVTGGNVSAADVVAVVTLTDSTLWTSISGSSVVICGSLVSLTLVGGSYAYSVGSNTLTLTGPSGVGNAFSTGILAGQVCTISNTLTQLDGTTFIVTGIANSGASIKGTPAFPFASNTSTTSLTGGTLTAGSGLYTAGTVSSSGVVTLTQTAANAALSYGGYASASPSQPLFVNTLSNANGFPLEEMCLQQQLTCMDGAASAANTTTWISGMSVAIGCGVVYNGYSFVASVSFTNSTIPPNKDVRFINCGLSAWSSWTPTLLSGAANTYNFGQVATYIGTVYYVSTQGVTGSNPVTDSQHWTAHGPGISYTTQPIVTTLAPFVTYSPSTNLFTMMCDTYGFGGSQSTNLPGLYGTSAYNYGDDTYNDCTRDSYGLNSMFPGTNPNTPAASRTALRSAFDENFHIETDTWFSCLFSNFQRITLQYTNPATLVTTAYDHWIPQVTPAMQSITYSNPVIGSSTTGGALVGASPQNGIIPAAVNSLMGSTNSSSVLNQRISYGVISMWPFTQSSESSSTLWSPIDSIVLVSRQAPSVEWNTSALAVLGQSGISPQSTVGSTTKTLVEFSLPKSSATAYRSFVYYVPTAEYQRVSLTTSGSGFSLFDFQLYWRSRSTGGIVPIVISNGGSLSAVFVLERK